MSDHILDKSYVAGGSTAYAFGECVVPSSDGIGMTRATSAAATTVFVCQEACEATKVTTGKAVLGVRVLGITKCLAGGAVSVGAKVANNTSARAVAGGAAGTASFGIALTEATANGDLIEVLLTPGNTM